MDGRGTGAGGPKAVWRRTDGSCEDAMAAIGLVLEPVWRIHAWCAAFVSSAFPHSLSYGRISLEYASERKEMI